MTHHQQLVVARNQFLASLAKEHEKALAQLLTLAPEVREVIISWLDTTYVGVDDASEVLINLIEELA